MTRLAALAALLGLIGAASPACAAPPSRIELTYTITMGSLRIGEGHDLVEHDGTRYRIVSESRPRGLAALFINDLRRESRGTIRDGKLRPDQFEETGRKTGTRAARFDWAAGQLSLTNGADTRAVALPPGTLDPASLSYAFSFFPVSGESVEVHLTDGRGVRLYRYREIGQEVLATPLGEIKARHFEKVRGPDDKRGFEFWLAPDRYLLPVKLRYLEKNGDVFESVITDIKTR